MTQELAFVWPSTVHNLIISTALDVSLGFHCVMAHAGPTSVPTIMISISAHSAFEDFN